jgi:hypothetical protein
MGLIDARIDFLKTKTSYIGLPPGLLLKNMKKKTKNRRIYL